MEGKKILWFEGAGIPRSSYVQGTDVSNCRIRTAFHLDNGRAVLLELQGIPGSKYHKHPGRCNIFVSGAYFIDEGSESLSEGNRIAVHAGEKEYSLNSILSVVNGMGASFEEVRISNELDGYCVWGENNGKIHFGDEFTYDEKLANFRYAVRREVESTISDDYSIWVDDEDPSKLHLLILDMPFGERCFVVRCDLKSTPEKCLENMELEMEKSIETLKILMGKKVGGGMNRG